VNGRLVAVVGAALVGCGGGGGDVVASPAEQAAWLSPHDAVRAGTFPGVTLTPTPTPALPALGWSASAFAVAHAWASRCSYGHNPDRGADGTPRGENIAASTPGHWATPADVVGDWASEWADYTYATNACAAGAQCGHYTQIVWRSTSKAGCARATCTVNSPFSGYSGPWEYYVCDYEPPGNYRGQRPY